MDRTKFKAPYYAVIFSYQRSKNLEGYQKMNETTLEIVKKLPGFLGYEVTGNGSEHAIFISYWQDMAAINNWKKNEIHLRAKQKGKADWYQWYHSQICKVEHSNFHALN